MFRRVSANSSLAVACAAVFFVAGCSGSAPTSPSTGAVDSGSRSGAVIDGTVSEAAGSGLASLRLAGAGETTRPSAHGQMLGLTVRVVGSDLVATVGGDGSFRLVGVPGGTIRLQFANDVVNATTELTNVSGDQVIQLEVQVTATSAVVVKDVREGKLTICHAEGNGGYHEVTVSTSAEAAHRAHGDGMIDDPVPGRPGMMFDEDCQPVGPGIDIEKSTNGADADNAPGPDVTIGDPVVWEYRVSNTGTLNLTGIVVSDDRGVAVDCAGQVTLAPGATFTCTGAGIAALGPYANVGSVTANWASTTASGSVSDSDASHYRGVPPDNDDEGARVTLCHRTGNGRYVQITISVDAEPAHRAHGDAAVGEPVPGAAGRIFNNACGTE